jgi:hypothetical protein
LILNKGAKTIQWRNDSLSTNGPGATRHLCADTDTHYTFHKNQL